MSYEQIVARLAELGDEITTLAALDDLDDTQQTRWDEANSEFDRLAAERTRLEERTERINHIREVASRPANVESGTRLDAPNVQVRPSEDNIYDLRSVEMRTADPTHRGRMLRDNVMRAVETWDVPAEAKETVERHVAGASRGGENASRIAEHILRVGSPAYSDAFFTMLRNPIGGMLLLDEKQRTALAEGSNGAGGFLVPPMLDPTIVLTNNGTTNPLRGIATVKTIATQTWKGVTSAGVTAEWTAEAAEFADASPTFTQPSISPVRADAWIQASFEMLEDTDIAMDIAMLLADARDRLESAAFAVGTGSTQPKGIVTAISAVTASRVAGSSGAAGAADFVLADVYALANALPPRHRPNSSWLAEQTILNKIRRFGEGTTANAAFWADLGVGIPSQLLGRPVYESSEMDNTIVSGSNDDVLLIGDFKKFYIVDRIGMSVAYESLVKGSNRRPTGEVGWAAFWRVGADAVDTGAFRLLRL